MQGGRCGHFHVLRPLVVWHVHDGHPAKRRRRHLHSCTLELRRPEGRQGLRTHTRPLYMHMSAQQSIRCMDAHTEGDAEMPQDTSSIFFHLTAIHSLKDERPRIQRLAAAAICPHTFAPALFLNLFCLLYVKNKRWDSGVLGDKDGEGDCRQWEAENESDFQLSFWSGESAFPSSPCRTASKGKAAYSKSLSCLGINHQAVFADVLKKKKKISLLHKQNTETAASFSERWSHSG